MIDAIHEGANCTLIITGPTGPLEIPCIYDALREERPVMGDGGGKKIVIGSTVVVPLADADYEDYTNLTFKIGQRVKLKIRSDTYDLRVDAKSLDEVSFNLSLISIDV